MELKRQLARAAILCSDGKNDEANRQLSEIEKEIKAAQKKPDHGAPVGNPN